MARSRFLLLQTIIGLFLSAAIFFPFHSTSSQTIKADDRIVLVLKIEGVINPASAEYIVKGIVEAKERRAELLVLRLDTPGGLDASMRIIIKKMIASPV